MKKLCLTAILFSSIFTSSTFAENPLNHNLSKENTRVEKKEVNPIYPISVICGSIAVAAGSAYYAIKESKKNQSKQYPNKDQ